MSERVPVVIKAQAVESENRGLLSAAELLSECLGTAEGGGDWPVRLHVDVPGADLVRPPPSVLIVSLLHEVERSQEPFAETEARWRARVELLLAHGAPVFLRTVFRHVAEPRDGAPSPLLERIRRLNRMAVGLSHSHGVGVIDLDRACAHIGGRWLQSDWRLRGTLAAEVAGHATAWSLLSGGLDEVVDPDLQEKAKASLGGLPQIIDLINRRLERHRSRRAAQA